MDLEIIPAETATRAERLALRVLQLGAIAVVVAASLHRGFDLDRFLVPKEIALHATALLAGLLTLRRGSVSRKDEPNVGRGFSPPLPGEGGTTHNSTIHRIDLALLAFVLLSAVSAVFATNPWLGMRALAVSASSYVIFRAARAVPSEPLLNALAFAVVLAASISLAQAYGAELELFSPNRSPGGTLGNRNFVGHAAAFGLPVVLLAALRGSRLAPFGVGIVMAALVLTRSRGAWLAAAAVALVFFVGVIRARAWKRFTLVLLFAAAGVLAALLVPNTLRWRSDNPYLDSLAGVASYDEGSGRGRLVQYERSLRMAAAHPLLGVGPGNWPVVYPEHAAPRDPSLDRNVPGMTHNPWPSSDWIACISERGFAATLLLGLAFLGLALIAFRDREDPLRATALLGTIAGAGVTGAFDAVLLLGAPALLVWAALGALVPRGIVQSRSRWGILAALAMIVITALGLTRSTAQLVAMDLFTRGSITDAARIDPGNFRARLRLARSGKRSVRCAHAAAAHALFPNAQAARSARCK
ncbi:MAG TPA: O-antigen ligase family protein [Thermoanaerobaculia bacterium]